jgi:hypothetical protein
MALTMGRYSKPRPRATCYHPLLIFNGEGDCLAAKLRPGSLHSAEGWKKLLLPEVERQQGIGKEVVFRWEDCRRERSKEGQLRAFGCYAGTILTRSAACGSTRHRRPD